MDGRPPAAGAPTRRSGCPIARSWQTFDSIRAEVGRPELILGCDCILRKIEIERKQLSSAVNHLFARNQVIGFATYGEQVDGMHVSQTFTGVAIGAARVA